MPQKTVHSNRCLVLLETLELHDVCGSPELSSLLMFWLSTNFGSRSETMMVSLQE